jgi:hypothetical protein
VRERLSISTEKELRFFGCLIQACQDLLEEIHGHVTILHIPDVPHARAAVQIAPVGEFHIYAFQGIYRRVHIYPMPIGFNADLIAGRDTEISGKMSW